MQKSRDLTDLCQVQQRRRARSLNGVMLLTANTGKSIEKRARKKGKKRGERDKENQTVSEERKEQVRYGNVCVYFSKKKSTGGGTGASKNVLRTLDITGSNVTRSRRELGVCLSRSGEERRRRDADGAGIPDYAVLRLLTITIDLALFYTRARRIIQIYSNRCHCRSKGLLFLPIARDSRDYVNAERMPSRALATIERTLG